MFMPKYKSKHKRLHHITDGLTEAEFRKIFHFQLKHKHDRNGKRKIVIGEDLSEKDMYRLGKTYVIL
jgi:hypothetical protein